MQGLLLAAGVWLIAAPLLRAETPLAAAELLRYTLEETPAQLSRRLGPPVQIADADPRFITWFYQTDVADAHDHSHLLLFRKEDGKLAGVTRNFHIPVNVDALFPEAKSRTHYWPSDTDRQWSVRVRVLGDDRLAIAMGVKAAGQTTNQVIIARRSALRIWLPWLEAQLAAAPPTRD